MRNNYQSAAAAHTNDLADALREALYSSGERCEVCGHPSETTRLRGNLLICDACDCEPWQLDDNLDEDLHDDPPAARLRFASIEE